MLKDYSGARAAANASDAAGLAFLDRGPDPALTMEVSRCADAVQRCAARGGGGSYRLVHQASMITSQAMPVSML